MNYIIDNEKCQATINELEIKKRIHERLCEDLCQSFRNTKHYTILKEQRVKECGTLIQLNENGEIISANFCKNRYCPICQWRKSRKSFAILYESQKIVEAYGKYEFLFLTLTIKNIKNLSEGITHILESFKRLQDTKKYRKVVKGFVRTLEITYNCDTKEWHPHLHILLAVPDNYFMENELYIDHEELVNMWKIAIQGNYYPMVNIQKVDEKEREKAIAEISKYIVKPISIELSKETELTYTELLRSTYNRRLTSMGGVYREAHSVVDENRCRGDTEKTYNVLCSYQFNGYNYINTEVQEKILIQSKKSYEKGATE